MNVLSVYTNNNFKEENTHLYERLFPCHVMFAENTYSKSK